MKEAIEVLTAALGGKNDEVLRLREKLTKVDEERKSTLEQLKEADARVKEFEDALSKLEEE